MALGKHREEQQEMWLATTSLPKSVGHVFYRKLNGLLAEADFDRTVEKMCEPYYHAHLGRPSIPPGVHYLADEIAGVWRGMALVIGPQKWTATFARQSPRQMATTLLSLARRTKIEGFLANSYGKKRRKKRRLITHGGHVSTYRILQERKVSHVLN
jgi:hypothetical protein